MKARKQLKALLLGKPEKSFGEDSTGELRQNRFIFVQIVIKLFSNF